jgi:hypothetical protein
MVSLTATEQGGAAAHSNHPESDMVFPDFEIEETKELGGL